MELLDRYLQEVRRYLPEGQQDDIIAEISDAIQSQAEERQAQLGRSLTMDEETAIIKAFGHPKIAASGYRPPEYLIGPDIYPFYWYTLRIVLIAVLSVELFGGLIAALVSSAPVETFLQSVAIMWPTIFTVFGIVTVVFVSIERAGGGAAFAANLGTRWNPRALAAPGQKEISRFNTLIEAIANIVVLLLLLDVPYVRHTLKFMTIGPAVNYLQPLALTSNWQLFFMLTTIAVGVVVAQDVVLLVYPAQTRLRAGALLVADILMVIGAATMLPSHSYVTVSHVVTAHAPHAIAALNQTIYVTFVILAISWAVAGVVNIRILLKRPNLPNFNISYNGIH